MFSYLEVVKNLVNESTYQRGLKYYLEGKTSKKMDLELDFWREYQVIGNSEYLIKIPILHLALDSSKFAKASIALEQIVTCNCGYFCDYNKICKHIVAVCASLEDEFGLNLKKIKTQIKTQRETKYQRNNIFKDIFEAEKDKQIRHFQYNWQDYLTSSRNNPSKHFSFLEEFVRNVSKSPEEYQEFLESWQKDLFEDLRDYEKEKKIVQIIPLSILVGKKTWWDFWRKLLIEESFGEESWINLNQSFWKIYFSQTNSDISQSILNFLKNLKKSQKEVLFKNLKLEFESKQEVWLNFALEVGYFNWLDANMDFLDPLILIDLALKNSENREEIETRILDKIKVWSDFLPSDGNYTEILEVFDKWQLKLGQSLYFEEAKKYFEQNHKKKRKLIKGLNK
jgi:hypothetical protein